jgi:hypothetical protein
MRRSKTVWSIKVTIERFTNESNPGFVECSFTDAAGSLVSESSDPETLQELKKALWRDTFAQN